MSEAQARNIVLYPYIAEHNIPGRCRHQVLRLGRVESCCRPARHAVAGVGLCGRHYGQYEFWQRGGQIGTPQEIFDRLVADGVADGRGMTRHVKPDGAEEVTGVLVPRGWAIGTTRGGKVGYAGLSWHVARDGRRVWTLEYPTGGRRRVARRRVADDVLLKLDREVGGDDDDDAVR